MERLHSHDGSSIGDAHIHPILLSCATVAAMAMVVALNLGASDDAGQTTLLAIILFSALLGAAWYRLAWLPGVALGVTVALAHAVSQWFHLAEPPMSLPPGVLGTLSLLALVLPAAVAAYAGAGVRRLVRR